VNGDGDPYGGQVFGAVAARKRASRYTELRAGLKQERDNAQMMYGGTNQAGAAGQSAGSSALQQGLSSAASGTGKFLGGALATGLSGILGGGGGSAVSSLWNKSASIGPSTWMSGFGIK